MARSKDGISCSVSCRILDNERFNRLKLYDQAVVLKLWLLAVRERTPVFPSNLYGAKYLAFALHIDQRFYKKSFARIAEQKLIEILPDGSIIVNGVAEYHRKLKWRAIDDGCA